MQTRKADPYIFESIQESRSWVTYFIGRKHFVTTDKVVIGFKHSAKKRFFLSNINKQPTPAYIFVKYKKCHIFVKNKKTTYSAHIFVKHQKCLKVKQAQQKETRICRRQKEIFVLVLG